MFDPRLDGSETESLLVLNERFDAEPHEPRQRIVVGHQQSMALAFAAQHSLFDKSRNNRSLHALRELIFRCPTRGLGYQQKWGVHSKATLLTFKLEWGYDLATRDREIQDPVILEQIRA